MLHPPQSSTQNLFNETVSYNQTSRYLSPQFFPHQTILYAYHPPITQTSFFRLLVPNKYPNHAASLYTNTLHNNDHQPMYTLRNHAFCHPCTNLNILFHRSKYRCQYPPYCFETIHLRSGDHLTMSKHLLRRFCFRASLHCINYHHSTDKFQYHVYDHKHTHPQICFCQSMFQHPYRAVNHPSILLHT